MSEATTTTTQATTRRTGGKADKPTASKFGKLWALASKATARKFTVSHNGDEGTVALRCDGFPATLTPADIVKLAEKNGGKVTVKGESDSGARLNASGTAGAGLAGELVREMLAD
jgi:hypothetical protein